MPDRRRLRGIYLAGLLALIVGVGGCERQAPPSPAGQTAPPQQQVEWRFPDHGRLVAIGDLHGDLEATVQALQLAGAIDAELRWAGGQLTLVQTGDLLDRGNAERQIIDLLMRLKAEAQQAGGRVILLLGNHEIMNAQGDFRYVTAQGYRGWDRLQSRSPYAERVNNFRRARAAALLPGGEYARLFSTWNVTVIVGDTLFAHAGVLPGHLDHGIAQLNREIATWLRGDSPPPVGVFSIEAPFWTRRYGGAEVAPEACATLAAVLETLGVKRMVVGHTVQQGGISAACNERLYRIDIGLAKFYGGNQVQVLQIENQQAIVLHN